MLVFFIRSCIETRYNPSMKVRLLTCLADNRFIKPVLENVGLFKANIKSYKPLETAVIFFLANLFLKHGIG